MCCLRRESNKTAHRCVIGRPRWKTQGAARWQSAWGWEWFLPLSFCMLMGCEVQCNALHMIIVPTKKCMAPVTLTQFTRLRHSSMTLDDLPPGCLLFLPVWLRVSVPVCLLFTDEQLCICLPAWLSHHVHLTKAYPSDCALVFISSRLHYYCIHYWSLLYLEKMTCAKPELVQLA